MGKHFAFTGMTYQDFVFSVVYNLYTVKDSPFIIGENGVAGFPLLHILQLIGGYPVKKIQYIGSARIQQCVVGTIPDPNTTVKQVVFSIYIGVTLNGNTGITAGKPALGFEVLSERESQLHIQSYPYSIQEKIIRRFSKENRPKKRNKSSLLD